MSRGLIKGFASGLFGNGFIDEVLLKEQCDNLLKDINGRLTPEVLSRILDEDGIDKATLLIYQWLREYQHRDFITMIDGFPSIAKKCQSSSKLLIMPGMFHKEYPELGGDGKIIQSITQRFGFDSEIVASKSTGDLEENADILRQSIRQSQNRALWLISISKGSAETGLCLKQLQQEDKNRIRGWISLCGIVNGSPIADVRLRYPGKLIIKLYTWLLSANYRALEQMRTSNPVWQQNLSDFDGDLVHVQPMPVASYVHAKLIKRYRQIAHLGPNDGTILLDDLLKRRGHIYPLWGVDHFFRDPAVVPLIYKLCHYIHMRDNKRNQPYEYHQDLHGVNTNNAILSI